MVLSRRGSIYLSNGAVSFAFPWRLYGEKRDGASKFGASCVPTLSLARLVGHVFARTTFEFDRLYRLA